MAIPSPIPVLPSRSLSSKTFISLSLSIWGLCCFTASINSSNTSFLVLPLSSGTIEFTARMSRIFIRFPLPGFCLMISQSVLRNDSRTQARLSGRFFPLANRESGGRQSPALKKLVEKATKGQSPDRFNQAEIAVFPSIQNVDPVCAPVGKYHELAGRKVQLHYRFVKVHRLCVNLLSPDYSRFLLVFHRLPCRFRQADRLFGSSARPAPADLFLPL